MPKHRLPTTRRHLRRSVAGTAVLDGASCAAREARVTTAAPSARKVCTQPGPGPRPFLARLVEAEACCGGFLALGDSGAALFVNCTHRTVLPEAH